MASELTKPTFRPSQVIPEQALFQAVIQGSIVHCVGSAKMSPRRIWSSVLNDVTRIT